MPRSVQIRRTFTAPASIRMSKNILICRANRSFLQSTKSHLSSEQTASLENPPLILVDATDPTETLLQRNISGSDPAGADGKRPEMQLCLEGLQKKHFDCALCRSLIAEAAKAPMGEMS